MMFKNCLGDKSPKSGIRQPGKDTKIHSIGMLR